MSTGSKRFTFIVVLNAESERVDPNVESQRDDLEIMLLFFSGGKIIYQIFDFFVRTVFSNFNTIGGLG